ncbi:diaminobutyrate--2-oxoglutarate transaminase [Plantactinospora sp. BB1]|uniref:diaminobutyrate--2-oxoglutarate transaminase n=1 Tax=Plantactinospora sp. BB1 TaxID=2071627 RepID=UPI000D16A7F3|nr:diaminobutyrate--2-oxoglutarate transaminase [Plantactinospora sp. BB1]AVT38331.1 diaminobutyrate--2-oxoglutarate transaminase [Plantactinospora sp. BB1]
MNTLTELESNVRSYCRVWPTVFHRAAGSWIYSESGRPYLDFFSGAGTLNYGHNNPVLKRVVLDYLAGDGIVHGLDMDTVAKREFLRTFHELVLRPRNLDYRVQLPGPGGTNAVEAALKLARKVTGRQDVVCFGNAFHGMTLGALAVSGNAAKRHAAGVPLGNVTVLPYDADRDDVGIGGPPAFERMLRDTGSGSDRPAAVIVETVQGEGGVNVARPRWLRALAESCRRHGVLLIVDDVQMGCGRTGTFFSFEAAGIVPDIVCLAKSISGYGLPMALTLIRPDLDVWAPGEHNGTFRGNNLAFAAAAATLRHYWADDSFAQQVRAKGEWLAGALREFTAPLAGITTRGRGLVHGVVFASPGRASKVAAEAFDRGLLVETSGADAEVVKLLPPLTASIEELGQGLAILTEATRAAG